MYKQVFEITKLIQLIAGTSAIFWHVACEYDRGNPQNLGVGDAV